MSTSQTIYTALQNAGVDVLLDDRKDRAGVKFKDADLIGYPLPVSYTHLPEQEVSLLMSLIKEYLNNNVKYMHEHNVRIRFIGFIGGLSEDLQDVYKRQMIQVPFMNVRFVADLSKDAIVYLDVYKRQACINSLG